MAPSPKQDSRGGYQAHGERGCLVHRAHIGNSFEISLRSACVFVHRKLLRLILGGLLVLGVTAMPLFAQQAAAADSPPWVVKKRGVELDIRSEGQMLRDRLATYGTLVPNQQQRGSYNLPDL